jgi:hypothetical protein
VRWSTTSFLPGFLLCGCIVTPLHAQMVREDTPELLFLCGWESGPPATRRLIVDLALDAGHLNRMPNADDIRAVQAAGGHVLYQFRIAVLRAELDTGAIRDLIDGPHAIANAAYAVPDTSKYYAYVQIFYKRPITDRDEDALGQLGLSDRLKMPIPVILAVTPDSLIPRIATLPGVDFIRARSIACLASQPSTPLVPRPHSRGGARSNLRLRLSAGQGREMNSLVHAQRRSRISCCLTRACSRQTGVERNFWRARRSSGHTVERWFVGAVS